MPSRTVYITDEQLWEAFATEANMQGKSVSALLCDAIQEYLERRSGG